MGILNRTPDSFYDKGHFALATWWTGPHAWSTTVPTSSTWRVKAGPAGRGRGRGARPVIPAIEASGPVRSAPVRGHLAGQRGQGRLCSGRWSATTSAGSPTRTTWGGRGRRRHGGGHAHPARTPHPRPRPVYDDVAASVRIPARAGLLATAAGCRRTGSCSTPVWTRKTAVQSLTLLRSSEQCRLGTRCSCRRRTRPSSVWSSVWNSANGAMRRWRPRRSARQGLPDHAGARRGRPPQCAMPWPPSTAPAGEPGAELPRVAP